MSIRWSLDLRREAASVPFARRLLAAGLEAVGVDPEICQDLSLALSEACANAVEHANAESSDGYRVTAVIEGDRCRIEVTDFGPGFCRQRLRRRALRTVPPVGGGEPAEHGRGMFIIESLVDNVSFRNHPLRGATVSFDKALKWREDALPRAC